MTRLDAVRYAVLLVPVGLLVLATRGGRTDRREAGALLLSGLAALLGVAVLNEIALAAGWWTYLEVDGAFRGVPVDLWLGWALLWGPVPVALRRHVPLPAVVVGAAWIDVLAMPHLWPVVNLGDRWLVGEAVGIVVALVPAVLLGRWTADRTHLGARTTLQLVVFAGVVGWLLPSAVFAAGDGGWQHAADLTGWQRSALVQLAAVLALPGVAAVHELAVRGHGTPYPWDPTDRLVTSGPYAYVANPMQVSATALLLLLAAATHSWSLALAAVGAVAFSATVAAPHEAEHLRGRFGPAWSTYRAEVADWRPRSRPYVPAPATVWLADGCDLCRELCVAVVDRDPVGLEVATAERHPSLVLRRARLEAADGHADVGIAAVGRALEHLHLGVAPIGWVLRLPLVRPAAQWLADASGAGPRDLAASAASVRRVHDAPAADPSGDEVAR